MTRRVDKTVLAECGKSIRLASLCLVVLLTAACAHRPAGQDIYDPLEPQNRKVHEFNRSLDSKIVRPLARTFGGSGGKPGPVRRGISNFASNIDQPRHVVNNVLQGRGENAGHNMFRFLVNTVFGFGGLLDPATDMGLEERDTDFGETLHVWGSGEGRYLELPLLGPSTERDALGRIVDTVLNPARAIGDEQLRTASSLAGAADKVGDRSQFSNTVDDILYQSADSYAQTRLLYLQNRRFKLGQDTAPSEEDGFDPFESFDAQ